LCIVNNVQNRLVSVYCSFLTSLLYAVCETVVAVAVAVAVAVVFALVAAAREFIDPVSVPTNDWALVTRQENAGYGTGLGAALEDDAVVVNYRGDRTGQGS